MQQQQQKSFLHKIFCCLKSKSTKKNILSDSASDIEQVSDTLKVYNTFKTIPIQQLEQKSHPQGNIQGKTLWTQRIDDNILYYEQNGPLTQQNENGFFHAFRQAYINHGDIKITPDQVWMTIMLYFSKYVDNNAEQLRKAFVHHQGKQQIVIQTFKDQKQTQWNEFFQKVIVQIQQKTVKGATKNLQCDFSTTNLFNRVFSTTTIMGSFKKYFDFTRQVMGCGIQNVHMAGKLQDWQKLCQKLKYLKNFDVSGQMKSYVKGLLPVLQQFVQTYKGNAHLQFWNNIYQERQYPKQYSYDPSIILNGWLIKFFTTRDQLYDQVVRIQQIEVPVKIINHIKHQMKQVQLMAGCRGIIVSDKGVYSPHFSVAIVQNKALAVKSRRNQIFDRIFNILS